MIYTIPEVLPPLPEGIVIPGFTAQEQAYWDGLQARHYRLRDALDFRNEVAEVACRFRHTKDSSLVREVRVLEARDVHGLAEELEGAHLEIRAGLFLRAASMFHAIDAEIGYTTQGVGMQLAQSYAAASRCFRQYGNETVADQLHAKAIETWRVMFDDMDLPEENIALLLGGI